MTNFLRIIPDSDSDLDIATREFLRIASETPPTSEFTVAMALEQALSGECLIYAVINPESIGALVLKVEGESLTVLLLGGENIKSWRDDAKAHVLKVMKQLGSKHLVIIGRIGWLKIFPELDFVAVIYALPAPKDSN